MDEWPKRVLILCSVVIQSQLSSMLTMSLSGAIRAGALPTPVREATTAVEWIWDGDPPARTVALGC